MNPVNQPKHKPHISLSVVRKLALIVVLILISANIGYRLGARQINLGFTPQKQFVVNASPPASREVDFSLFWDVWSRLEQKYIDKSKIDAQKMVYGAIEGMVSSLGDPYTVFLPPKENSDFKGDLSGEFEGIGAQLGSKDDKIIIIAPLKDNPAEKAGLKPGDWIIKVNDEDTSSWTVPQAVTKIRGPKGSTVTLTIISQGDTKSREVKVLRDTITIKSVTVEFKPTQCGSSNCPEVAYIVLSRFGDSTNDEWGGVINQILPKKNDIRGVILDMRNNPGGYFQSAIHIASEFIKSGVIVLQENSDGTRETFSVSRVGNLLDTPLMILVNKGSASAAEIVAGALKDHNRGKLIGEKTFGKGSVQQPEDLPDGSGLHITTARWIMPKGDWINGKGITPDIEVVAPIGSASATVDPQLDRAILELSK